MNYDQSLNYKNEVIERLKELKKGPLKKEYRPVINGVIKEINSVSSLYKKQMKKYDEPSQQEINNFVKMLDTYYARTRGKISKNFKD